MSLPCIVLMASSRQGGDAHMPKVLFLLCISRCGTCNRLMTGFTLDVEKEFYHSIYDN